MQDFTVVISAASLLLAVGSLVWSNASRSARLENATQIVELKAKVEIIWAFLLKRAGVEGVHAGLMEIHSPVRLVGNSGEILIHMADELKQFYNDECQGRTEPDIAMMIERKFGTRLAAEICVPNKISFGVCLLIAVAVAKGVESLKEILDHNVGEPPLPPPTPV